MMIEWGTCWAREVHDRFPLTPSMVKQDSSKGTLIGGAGRDWYLLNCLSSVTLWRDVINALNIDSASADIDSRLQQTKRTSGSYLASMSPLFVYD